MEYWLSLFDGMSCLQIAAKELGISPHKYYASEIDQHAIKQTQLNFPDTIQLGSVTEWETWDIDWSKVDLIGAGSPCQGFSFAGKQLAFDDPRSVLFFVFIDILNHCRKFNPNVKFLLENVDMKREHMNVINNYCGLFAVNINSNRVSAQNRNRWYWSNIRTKQVGLFGETHTDIPQPKDRGILLKDILEKEVAEKYYLSDKVVQNLEEHKQRHKEQGHGFGAVFHKEDGKMQSLKVGGKGIDDLICVAMRGRNPYNPSDRRTGSPTEQRLEPNLSGKTNFLTSVQKDNLVMQLNERQQNNFKNGDEKANTFLSTSWKGLQANGMTLVVSEATAKGFIEVEPGECFDFENPKSKTRRGRKMEDKSNCLMAKETDFMQYTQTNRIRRLTPTECARLQTIPEWYKWGCSDTQQYRMLGNGWTVQIITHILSFLK